MATNQIAFDQQDSHSTPEFERAMDRRCQALVSKWETLSAITFTSLNLSVQTEICLHILVKSYN